MEVHPLMVQNHEQSIDDVYGVSNFFFIYHDVSLNV